jgi:predicted nucleic acid-binding protein
LKEFENLCRLFCVGNLDNSVLDAAAKIYADQRKIGQITDDADIFIAAYCLNNKYILVTNNTKHFGHIPDLNIINWTNPSH